MGRMVPLVLLALLTVRPALAQGPENGFSPLDEITTGNVGRLAVAFTSRTGAPGAHTAAPLAAGDLLLVLTPFPHRLFALDWHRPGAPVRWRYDPAADETAAGLVCCGEPTGGIAVQGDRVYLNTLDDHVIALDRATGRVIWDVRVADPQAGSILTTAPLPVARRGDRRHVGR